MNNNSKKTSVRFIRVINVRFKGTKKQAVLGILDKSINKKKFNLFEVIKTGSSGMKMQKYKNFTDRPQKIVFVLILKLGFGDLAKN